MWASGRYGGGWSLELAQEGPPLSGPRGRSLIEVEGSGTEQVQEDGITVAEDNAAVD